MKVWFNRNSTHFIVAALFVALCFIYFNPAFSGKSLGQNDVTRAKSTQTEINEYKERGETILWTNQIHAGMPTFQIWAPYPNNITTWIVNGINYTFPKPSGTVLILVFGTYLLFSVLRLKPWLAAAGALAFTFSSYNIILLAAGHANNVFNSIKTSRISSNEMNIKVTDDAKLITDSDGNQTLFNLSDLYAYYDTKIFLFLYLSRNQYIILDKRQMKASNAALVVQLLDSLKITNR